MRKRAKVLDARLAACASASSTCCRPKATSAATRRARRPAVSPQFEIELKYFDGEPVIAEIARVSKPGRRVYSSIGDLKPVKNGLGISILSTPKGVMSDTAARDANVGGEVLCRVY